MDVIKNPELVPMDEIDIKTGCENMDFEKVAEMLSQAFWSPGIKIDEVKKGAVHSAVVVGAFHNGGQIGYARAVSDTTRFAYIMDVYVDERYRKQGIGQRMVKVILDHEDLREVYQWFLVTRDAHGVYAKVGFKELTRKHDWMEIRKPRPQR